MLNFNKKYLSVIVVTVVFLSNVESEFTVVPSDTEAAIGENATLYCTSSLGRCEWYHWPIGAHGHEILYQGGFIYNGYRGRFTVTEANNACNLQIKNVFSKDAGLFTCMETSIQATQTTAELIVFEKFPSDKTCSRKTTCAPIGLCNELELSCTIQFYGNLHPIMEWSDSNGKQINSTLSEDKATSTVHLKEIVLPYLAYICQVKYPSKSLSSKFVWSYSMQAHLEDKTTPASTTTEQPEQKTTVPVGVFVAAVVVSIVLLISTISIFLFYIKKIKRKAIKPGNNHDIEKKMDDNSRSPTDENGHRSETIPLRTGIDTGLEHDLGPYDNAVLGPPFTEARSNAIFGLAILNNEVFIVTQNKSNVEVFDLQTAICQRQWKVNGLIDPNDMAACPKTELIFICDWKNCAEEVEIFGLDKNGMLHHRWHCEGERGRISITKDCSLLITGGKKSVVYEYEYTGQLISTTHLEGPNINKEPNGMKRPNLLMCHAIKLESGNLVASFADEISKCHVIASYDNRGVIVDIFKNDPAYISARSFSTPRSLAVDSKGNIYLSTVGDYEKPSCSKINSTVGGDKILSCSKIISFTHRLEWKENILGPKTKHSSSDPLRICLCESENSGLLLVAENKIEDEKLVESKILDFNLAL